MIIITIDITQVGDALDVKTKGCTNPENSDATLMESTYAERLAIKIHEDHAEIAKDLDGRNEQIEPWTLIMRKKR